MSPYRGKGERTYKMHVRDLAGRPAVLSCGTRDEKTADDVARMVQRFRSRRGNATYREVLSALVDKRIRLVEVYDADCDGRLEEVVQRLKEIDADPNVEPFVHGWHAEKLASRKGAASADKYLRQVRMLIAPDTIFRASQFSRKALSAYLDGLKCNDPTRNRHKAALSSLAKFLVKRGVLDRNPLREIEGYPEGRGRTRFHERADAIALVRAVPAPYRALEAVMAGAGLEWQAVSRLRTRDVDLEAQTIFARGGKTAWRERTVRIVETWAIEHIRPALRGRLPNDLIFQELTERRALEQHHAACKALGITDTTLHDWRHTHAVQLLRDGESPQVVAHQLGHGNAYQVLTRYGRYVPKASDYRRPRSETATDLATASRRRIR